MKILETNRLILREINETNSAFILDLLNQPSFVKYIGDRNVRTIEEAEVFIANRLANSYAENGFGLYAVELKTELGTNADTQIAANEIQNPQPKIQNPLIGICGFVKRDTLPDADIGFAFLPQFCGKGFAFEAAEAVMQYGKTELNLRRVLAITTQNNETSGKLLKKLGFKFERLIKLPHDAEELKLFSFDM